MAITTIDGKFSLLCYNQPFQVVLTTPTSPFNQREKQGLMWQFTEILWAPEVAGAARPVEAFRGGTLAMQGGIA